MRKYVWLKCLFFFAILFFVLSDFSSCQIYAPGYDFRLFENTPASELAEAVEKQDTAKINILVKKYIYNLNYRENKFGNSLLTLAIVNNKLLSAKSSKKI